MMIKACGAVMQPPDNKLRQLLNNKRREKLEKRLDEELRNLDAAQRKLGGVRNAHEQQQWPKVQYIQPCIKGLFKQETLSENTRAEPYSYSALRVSRGGFPVSQVNNSLLFSDLCLLMGQQALLHLLALLWLCLHFWRAVHTHMLPGNRRFQILLVCLTHQRPWLQYPTT